MSVVRFCEPEVPRANRPRRRAIMLPSLQVEVLAQVVRRVPRSQGEPAVPGLPCSQSRSGQEPQSLEGLTSGMRSWKAAVPASGPVRPSAAPAVAGCQYPAAVAAGRAEEEAKVAAQAQVQAQAAARAKEQAQAAAKAQAAAAAVETLAD